MLLRLCYRPCFSCTDSPTSALSTLSLHAALPISRRGGEWYLRKRGSNPRSQRFRRWFDKYGLLTVFISALVPLPVMPMKDRKSTRLNSSHLVISYAVFCLKKKKNYYICIGT